MNATQTAIVEALTASNSYHSVAELVEMTGKGDTTIRTAIKVLLADGEIGVTIEDGKKLYTVIPEVPEDENGRPFGELVEDEDGAPLPNELQPADAQTPAEPVEVDVQPEAPQPQDEAVGAALDTAAAKPRKKYIRHETPQTRTTRINQITKAEIGVRKTSETPFPGIEEKWYAVCLTHNQAHGEEKLKDAHWFSSYPTFCTVCGPQLVGKVGRRRAHGTADMPAANETEE